MNSFSFVVGALAVWRVSHLLVFETGPAAIFERLRQRFAGTWLGSLLDCFYCTSMWVAVPVAAYQAADLFNGVLLWLALSAASCIALQITDKRRELITPAGPVVEQDIIH